MKPSHARRAAAIAAIVVSCAALLATGCTRILGINPWSSDASPADDAAPGDDAVPADDATASDAAATGDGNCNAVDSCGVCGRTCNTVGEACVGGSCVAAACAAGFGNCDAMAADGCETDLRSSAAHCGTCDRNCGGTACVEGVCEPTVFPQEQYIFSLAVRNGYVYWTQDTPPEIRRAPIGGGNSELACPSPNTPWLLMTDSAGLYWLALNGGPAGSVLKCTSPPCSTPTVLATSALGSDSPYNAISDASRIYWSTVVVAPPAFETVRSPGANPPADQ